MNRADDELPRPAAPAPTEGQPEPPLPATTAPGSMSVIDTPGTVGPLLRLAWPVLVEQLLHMVIWLSDQFLAGRYLDERYLAPLNLTIYILWLMEGLFLTVAIGATAMVARFVGAKDWRTAQHVTNQALLVGAAAAGVLTGLGFLLGPQLVRALQLGGESAALADRYLAYIYPQLPAMMILSVGIAALRGAGDMVSGLIVMAIIDGVNLAVSWALVLGLGPFPQRGWDGLAIGTASSYAAGGVLVLWLLARGRAGLGLSPALLLPNANLIRRLLRIGLPGGMDTLAIIACQLWFVAIINQLGDVAAAAHGVAIRIESLAFLPGAAFQMAAATLAGQFLGARDHHRAGRSVVMACLIGGGIMCTAGVLFFVQADFLSRLLLSADKETLARQAAPLLRIVAFAMPFLAITMILSGALRGAGDTRWPLVFTFIGYLVIRIPLAYLLAHRWGWGVEGAWLAMVADLVVRCGLVTWRFRHGGWKHVRV